jgi:hypothetical protein
VISNVLLNNKSNKDRKNDDTERDLQRAARDQEIKDKLDRLDEKIEDNQRRLDEHNGYAQKWAESKEHLAKISEKLEHLEKDSKENREEWKNIRKTISKYHGGA